MTNKPTTILIVGGYGIFGGRLAELLADEASFRLLIAGRSETKARQFCAHHAGAATFRPLVFDRDGDLDAQLSDTQADVIVDATGPFQAYGDDPYRLVKAAIRHHMHYLDLADGSDFVKGVSAFDAEAGAAGVFVLSGVSSFPVLTAAVLRELKRGMTKLDKLTVGIAPSPFAVVGLNVIRAIASYAGQPIKLRRDGKDTTAHAITEGMRYVVAPPGYLPLRSTLFTLVDVPDLQLVPDAEAALNTIWAGAGPRPEILHLMLSALAWMVRLHLLRSLAPFARFFYQVIARLRWGEHRGGMFVELVGTDDHARAVMRSWHLLAEGEDGPFIPSMAIEAILRAHLRGETPAIGARPATDALTLAHYNKLFANRTIYTGRRETVADAAPQPLYKGILGDAWDTLPPAIRDMHDVLAEKTAAGLACIERGSNPFARLVAALFGFPEANAECPVSVAFTVRDGVETWTRTFGTQTFSSTQAAGQGRSRWLVSERFGPFRFDLALVSTGERLELIVRRWSFLGVYLPLRLAPRGEAFEFVENDVFNFHVEIVLPRIGLVVRYRGWLKPVD